MLRRTKEEVLPELPPAIYEKIYLDGTKELMKQTDAEIVSPRSASIKKAIGLLKVKPAIKHIEYLLETKNKVVVFTWHKAVAAELNAHFGERSVLYTGDESTKQKDANKEHFIKDESCQVFIGQLNAAGIGLDGLQKVCDTAVFIEMTGVPGKIKQAVDRLRRIGQDDTVLAQFLIVEDSIDEEVVNKLIEKSKNINKIMQEEGKEVFVKSSCKMCGKDKELHELKRAAGLSVCMDCGRKLNCFN
jgi:SWI/SNF-related matrix-associated actin-dependent regulator 1 of chromatin subfamily A